MVLNNDKPSYYRNDVLNLFMSLLDFLKNTEGLTNSESDIELVKEAARSAGLDTIISQIAMDEKNKSVYDVFKYIIDQPVFMSLDHKRLRRFIKNWYTSVRSLITKNSKGIDPFFLNTNELDELIKSFGFPYPGYILGRINKVNFLYDLINFYQKKGTPRTFVEALKYFGYRDLVLSEWWLHEDAFSDIVFKSKPILPRSYRNNSDYLRTLEYEEVADVYWYQTKQNIINLNATEKLNLPSITPFISLDGTMSTTDLMAMISIIMKKMQETYEFWIMYVLNPYKTNVLSIENTPPSASVGNVYVVGTSPTGAFTGKENYYATKTVSGWTFEAPQTNHVIYLSSESTLHSVYNGTEWVHLYTDLVNSRVGSKRAYGRPDDLNRDMTLTSFDEIYSMFEIVLAIAYLFSEGLEESGTDRIVQYNGPLSPLDVGVIGTSGTSGISGYRDDIDDRDYQDIIDRYNEVTARPLSKNVQDSRYSSYRSEFTGQVTYASSGINGQYFVAFFQKVAGVNLKEQLLKAMNPAFLTDIDAQVVSSSNSTVLESVFSSFEYHLMRNMKILSVPITFAMLGLNFLDNIGEVVDFFKPYRVRLLDFNLKIDLGSKLENTQLEDDALYQYITMYLQDKGPWELDQGLVKDLPIVGQVEIFNEWLQRYDIDGPDEYYWLDRSFKDEFDYKVIDLFNDMWRNLNPDEFTEDFYLFMADICPGTQEYLDSPTLLDSVEITIEEV